MQEKSEKSSIWAVVVAYQPDEAFAAHLLELAAVLPQLIIVHNGAADGGQKPQTLPDGCHWLEQTANNLAAAQNIGIRQALDLHADYVLLLDDDSLPDAGMVAALLTGFRYPSAKKIAMCVPRITDRQSGHSDACATPWLGFLFRRFHLKPGRYAADIFTPIASGSLIKSAVFSSVGMMDETLPIDYTDRDFALRLLTQGYQIIGVGDAVLHHRLGATQMHGLVKVRHHSAARRYTIFKHRSQCWRRYGLKYPPFISYDLLAAAYDIFRILVFETDKKAKLTACMQGLRDGLFR